MVCDLRGEAAVSEAARSTSEGMSHDAAKQHSAEMCGNIRRPSEAAQRKPRIEY